MLPVLSFSFATAMQDDTKKFNFSLDEDAQEENRYFDEGDEEEETPQQVIQDSETTNQFFFEQFSELPEELQQEILKYKPVKQANSTKVKILQMLDKSCMVKMVQIFNDVKAEKSALTDQELEDFIVKTKALKRQLKRQLENKASKYEAPTKCLEIEILPPTTGE